ARAEAELVRGHLVDVVAERAFERQRVLIELGAGREVLRLHEYACADAGELDLHGDHSCLFGGGLELGPARKTLLARDNEKRIGEREVLGRYAAAIAGMQLRDSERIGVSRLHALQQL